MPVAEQVEGVLNSGRVGAFSVSETGLLAYREGAGASGAFLTWFDRSGTQGTAVGDAAGLDEFRLSPDSQRVAVAVQDRAGFDVWIYDVSRGLRTQLTFDAASDRYPVWSPDGTSIVFASNRKGKFDLYRKAVDSVGVEELLYASDLDKTPTSWSADGKWLLYDAFDPNSKTGRDLWALPLTPERPGAALKPSLVLQTTATEVDAQFSPNGQWILYGSNESQRNEIYVTPFPPSPSGRPGGKLRISTAGVALRNSSRWREDGREIFYVQSGPAVDGSGGDDEERHARSWGGPRAVRHQRDRTSDVRCHGGWAALPALHVPRTEIGSAAHADPELGVRIEVSPRVHEAHW